MPASSLPDHNLSPLAQTNRPVLASVRSCFWTLLAHRRLVVIRIHFVHLPAPGLFRRVHIYVNLPMREILFYRTWSGRSPVEDFIRTLPDRAQDKIAWVLKAIREDDHVTGKYLKKLKGTDQLWEVRTEYANRSFRILGFFDGSRLIVFVSAFVKKTEQTPMAEIRTAEERRRDYFRRKG